MARGAGTALQWVPLSWLGTIGVFFSLNSSRLEHYLMPAVPAAALMVGALVAEWAHPPQPATARLLGRWDGRRAPFLLLAGAGASALVLLPFALRELGATGSAPVMAPMGAAVAAVMAVGGVLSAALALRGRWATALRTVVLTYLAVGAGAAAGLSASDPLTSPRRLIRSIDPAVLASSEVAYEAGQEYQLCGVLDFYLGRRVLIPAPPRYVPPTYLKRYASRLFTDRETFRSAWARGDRRILLFTDPERPLDRPGEFPQPFYEIGRDRRRALLTNRPLEE